MRTEKRKPRKHIRSGPVMVGKRLSILPHADRNADGWSGVLVEFDDVTARYVKQIPQLSDGSAFVTAPVLNYYGQSVRDLSVTLSHPVATITNPKTEKFITVILDEHLTVYDAPTGVVDDETWRSLV